MKIVRKVQICKMHKFYSEKQKRTKVEAFLRKSYPQLEARKYRKNELYTKLFTLSTKKSCFFHGFKGGKKNKCFVNF